METTITTKKAHAYGICFNPLEVLYKYWIIYCYAEKPKVSQGHVGQHRALDLWRGDSMIHLPPQ